MTAARHARVARRRTAILGAALAALATVPALVGTATATTPLGTQARVSIMGPDGDANFDGFDASVAYNTRANQSLVVWEGDSTTAGKTEVWGRLADAQGTPVGSQFRISDQVDGDANFDSTDPTAAYNPRTNQYLVVWRGESNVAPLVDNEVEIFAQRLDASGAQVGTNDQRISDLGPNGDVNFDAAEPYVTYNGVSNEFLVVFQGDDDTAPQVLNEEEIFIQRIDAAGAEVGTNDRRISDTGIDGDANFDASDGVAVANEQTGEYLVAWDAEDATDNKNEMFIQRLTADGAETGTNDVKISDMGPDADANFDADAGAVAYNAVANEYLVAWGGDDNTAPLVDNETEVFIQRVSAAGAEVGTNDQRISDMGPGGNAAFTAAEPTVSHNFRANEYLVAWEGIDDAAPLVAGETEIYAQRLSGSGAEIGTDDARVSVMGTDGDPENDAQDPAVIYNSQANDYLIAWEADATAPPLANDEEEVYVRRFGAAVATAPATPVCVTLPPAAAPTPGDPSKITLSTTQLLINQRIDQAAIRRANGVQAWLDAGVQARDICQGALGSVEFQTGIVSGYTGLPIALAAPTPRPVTVPAAVPGDPSKVKLTTGQILINQRISQAAIRRLNGLKARLDAGLTGGDIVNGTLTRPTLVTGTQILFAPTPTSLPAKTTTVIAPATPGDPSKVTLTTNQLLINQRISQAAVRRANDLIRRLGIGLGAAEIKDGTITGADLASGLALATS